MMTMTNDTQNDVQDDYQIKVSIAEDGSCDITVINGKISDPVLCEHVAELERAVNAKATWIVPALSGAGKSMQVSLLDPPDAKTQPDAAC